MKDLKILVSEEEILKHMENLWKSEFFKTAMKDSSSFLYKFCLQIAAYPIVFCEYTEYKNERPHFATWYNVIYYRKYDNKVKSDLYYFHELLHRVTLRYFSFHLGAFDFHKWMEKMNQNELEASIHSEVLIYYLLPGLRKDSFKEEIWADRFLNEEMSVLDGLNFPKEMEELSNQELFDNEEYRPFFISALISQRRANVYVPDKYLKDPIELKNKAYYRNNIEFMLIWNDNAKAVEEAMSRFYETLNPIANRVTNDVREYAIKELLKFLKYNTGEGDPFPFYTEGIRFANVYYGFQREHQFKIYDNN